MERCEGKSSTWDDQSSVLNNWAVWSALSLSLTQESNICFGHENTGESCSLHWARSQPCISLHLKTGVKPGDWNQEIKMLIEGETSVRSYLKCCSPPFLSSFKNIDDRNKELELHWKRMKFSLIFLVPRLWALEVQVCPIVPITALEP